MFSTVRPAQRGVSTDAGGFHSIGNPQRFLSARVCILVVPLVLRSSDSADARKNRGILNRTAKACYRNNAWHVTNV